MSDRSGLHATSNSCFSTLNNLTAYTAVKSLRNKYLGEYTDLGFRRFLIILDNFPNDGLKQSIQIVH